MKPTQSTLLAQLLSAAAFALLGAGSANAAIVHISAGEGADDLATGGSGLTQEVITNTMVGTATWNNVSLAEAVSLQDSTGAATGLTVSAFGGGEFLDANFDPDLGEDIGSTLLSKWIAGGGNTGTTTLTISGFAADQQLGDLDFYTLFGSFNNPMTVNVNGDSQSVPIQSSTQGFAATFEDVVANASGEVVISSTELIVAVSLDTIPEPGSLALIGIGGLLLIARRRRS